MKEKVFSKKISIAISFLLFAIVVFELIYLAYPVQMIFKNTGLVMTELLLVVTAVGGCIILRQPTNKVFPIKVPRVGEIFGVIVLWCGVFIATITVGMLMASLFTQEFLKTGVGLSSVIEKMPIWTRLLVMALIPAVCEEAVHRGLIMHFLKPVQKKWVIMFIIGIEFGILHMDFIRFPITSIFGFALAYVLLKTDNILLCIEMHFINNAVACLPSAKSASTEEALSVLLSDNASLLSIMYMFSFGAMLFLCTAVPWIIYASSLLLSEDSEGTASKRRKIIICSIISIVCVIFGTLVLSSTMPQVVGGFSKIML